MKPITTCLLSTLALACSVIYPAHGAETKAEVQNVSVNGGIEDGRARLVIEAQLKGLPGDANKVIFATSLEQAIKVTRDRVAHRIAATLDVLQGEPKELPLTITGEGEITSVTGEQLQDWSIRRATNGKRVLVLRPRKGDKPVTQLKVVLSAEREMKTWDSPIMSLAFAPPQPALFNGFVKVDFVPEFEVQAEKPSGLLPVELKYLPSSLRAETKPDEPEPLAFQFHGTAYTLPLRVALADPETRRVVLRDFKLTGRLEEHTAAFTLAATARVRNPDGGTLRLLSGGGLALTALEKQTDWRVRFESNHFVLVFDKPGDLPVTLQFNAAVGRGEGWNRVDFHVAPGTLQPVVLRGLAANAQLRFGDAARPERVGNEFLSHLPPDGMVKLAWKDLPKEEEGKLFYAAEMLSQITVSPGLLRQTALLDFKVMQGELNRVTLLLHGDGEVTRVLGEQVLAWKVEPETSDSERRLVVQFNQPQKNSFALQVQIQTPLGAFPQTVDATRLLPEGTTRFAGYHRIVNDGAVRLEVTQATGLSQISPEQFPETDATKTALRMTGNQRFAYRFSSADYALRIQADQILPEVNVSQVLAYTLGENDLAVDGELELDIREAPLRELLLNVPKGYAIARLTASGLSDYFLSEPPNQTQAELRLVYGQPVTDRQLVQLRLERNQSLGETNWVLPRIEVVKAKSVRGHVGAAADAGFRLSASRTAALTEIATAFFPRKVAGLQAAFRLSEPNWAATLLVERLPQSVQADALHLFSIGEGIAYGSSVLNFLISGAPVGTFRIELSEEYFNVEFAGKDIRNWQKTTNGFLVQLNTPVAGAYTLLATYERPFKAQGETLTFTGARPLDVQSERGHTLIVSAYQFQVQSAEVSPGLLPLEIGEVPPEYRLFFDAPILAAYRYVSRPFNLRLALQPLAQGESLSVVVDRALLVTRVSKEGQVLTDVSYLIKNRGNPNLRLTLPAGTELWSATINGAPVVPVKDATSNLIPLPQHADPNAVLKLDLKLAAKSSKASRVNVAAPTVSAPVMLAEWRLQPDTGQRLEYRKGSLTPVGGAADGSGFAQLARVFDSARAGEATLLLLAGIALVGLASVVWRWAAREGVFHFSVRHFCGAGLGCLAMVMAAVAFVQLASLASRYRVQPGRDVTLLAPVQQADSALEIEIANVPEEASAYGLMWASWPALLAIVLWVYAWLKDEEGIKLAAKLIAWGALAWATLRLPHGVPWLLGVLGVFLLLHVIIPALRRLWSLPHKPIPPASPQGGSAAAVAALTLLASLQVTNAADSNPGTIHKSPPLAETIIQEIRVDDQFALATAKIQWQAEKGQALPLLFDPAVVTQINHPPNALKLVQVSVEGRRVRQLLAQESGMFDIEVRYQVHVAKRDAGSGFVLPTQYGLVNQISLTLANLDVDVASPQAVSVQRESIGSNTVAKLVLAPANEAWIGWKPRSRDVRSEKPVYYAELTQLYVPAPGVIESAHWVAIRPAQGELGELILDVPRGATITDVADVAKSTTLVSLWRFDPDTRKLRVTLNPPQSRPFALLVRSQVATGPLPVEQSVGLLSVDGVAGQIGLLGVATGNEVQLDAVTSESCTPINLEDYPADVGQSLAAQVQGLTVRRAFRYADAKASAVLKASAVEPDVRVTTQDTLSLGEDRTVLAANATVSISRAGIFRLSFAMPEGFDVESLSGAALSHWTELKTDAGRVITLHLKGKTTGQQQFSISLAGPGLKADRLDSPYVVPQIVLREAGKQQGTLVIVPEQGMQLQTTASENISPLDPQRAGIRQKGVLAFRMLQSPWQLTLRIEQVAPWIQVTSLQHATVTEAQIKVTANLQYQIENTGLKSFRVFLPTNADSVRFQGQHVSDFLRVPDTVTNGVEQWEVKLERRVIGAYLLQATFQTLLSEQTTATTLAGVQAVEANMQRGFVTLQAGGRLQVSVDSLPEALQPTEWQSIPRALQQSMQAAPANFTYRLVEPAFQLPLKLDRHEAAKLLPARVNNITFTSVISDDGVMLTQARLELLPGDKRLLRFTLPKEARFWFAFVNQNGVWPWREKEQVLIPLERQSRPGKAVPVEVFYTSRVGRAGGGSLDLALLAPKYDLPLENISWRVYLNEKWLVTDWSGTLQLQREQVMARTAALDLQSYLQKEAALQREKTQEAEQMLALGNTALERGDPQQARRAFQAAYGLSTHDNAFNEDARVQLNNLKLQQALVGLNVRQAAAAGDASLAGLAERFRDARGKEANYTQQDAKQLIDRNSADENAAYMRLAEKLVQQQDAAVTSPSAIRANVPEQGRLLTFQRAVAVDKEADLRIGLEARAVRAASWGMRLLILAGTLVLLGAFGWLGRGFARADMG